MVLYPKYCFRPCVFLFRNVHSAIDSNHYKTLGLTPSATKAEIKAAYYELSKKHHPDLNQGSKESARIFKLVKAAYEVLGNEQKRIQYDKDRIFKNIKKPVSFYRPDDSPDYKDEAERIHFHSKARPPFRKYSYGKTSYYDFDEWYYNHYVKCSEQEQHNFKRPKNFKSSYHAVTKDDIQLNDKLKRLFLMMFYVMLFLSTISLISPNKKRVI